ncbi:hypothetical protein FKW77_010173 [Venturia effusa]|uniref:WSC domain-containing protein n=1 Tax=Venturia effusa TaxID=50376 RepID=A0A517L8B6_9PEZI|nr:hypothetical protein FKW77_010173 [Venturia effusa]
MLTGRVDPVVNPGAISAHAHNIVGGYNIGMNSSYDDMLDSKCTSCEIAADKSAYWTPQLYYQHSNGTFQDVPNGGMIAYYLGRGDDLKNVKPFPRGFKMLSGNTTARSYDNTTKTWNGGRPIADRVSFVCLDNNKRYPEEYGMKYTDCGQIRAQIHMPSCWDGINAYKADNSHVAYLSQMLHVHLFYEMYYDTEAIQEPGGKFVFANGDTTGYGFHGDFINGWENSVLSSALGSCAQGEAGSGQISDCPPLAAVNTKDVKNCPERPALINEPVKGLIEKLPGCNSVTSGADSASHSQKSCDSSTSPPSINPFVLSRAADAPTMPSLNRVRDGWQYVGSANEPKGGRALTNASSTDAAMTIEKCQQFCSSKNLSHAGVEYGTECYCGSELGSGGSLSTTESTIYNSMVCAGDRKQFCGGPGRVMVFKKVN